jgi:hypothetical protein
MIMVSKRFIALATALVMAGAAGGLALRAEETGAKDPGLHKPLPVKPMPPTTRPIGERFPAIRKAVEDLRDAKAALEHAEGDFDGHRAQAIKEIDEALKQCELAVKSALEKNHK